MRATDHLGVLYTDMIDKDYMLLLEMVLFLLLCKESSRGGAAGSSEDIRTIKLRENSIPEAPGFCLSTLVAR